MKTPRFALGGSFCCPPAVILRCSVLMLLPGRMLGDTPSFTLLPVSQTVFAGQNVLFSAQANSTLPVQYQWRLNGVDLPGETNSTLKLFAASLTQTGQLYTVMATNAGGAAITPPATLQVQVPTGGTPVYTWGSNPAAPNNNFSPTTHRSEQGAIFLVNIYDTNLSSIWGTDVYTDDSSLTAAAVHTGLLQPGQRGTVRLRILPGQGAYPGSTRNGVTTSTYAQWVGSYELLGLAPTITTFPMDQARMVGATATFSVQAYGEGPVQYQWSFNGIPIRNATGPVLSFPVTSEDQAGSYSVAITDNNATVVQNAVLAVLPFKVGVMGDAFLYIASLSVGGVAQVQLTGNTNDYAIYGNGFYQGGSDLSRAVVHAGLLQRGETGVVALVRLPDQPSFSGTLANGVMSTAYSAGTAFSFLGRVPQVLQDPASQVLLPGQTAYLTFRAAEQGNPDFRIQWRKNGQDIPGANGSSLQVNYEGPGLTANYDAILSLPGNPTLTLPATIITPVSSPRVYTVGSPAEAAPYLTTAGNLIYVPVTGATPPGGGVWGTGVYTIDSNMGMAAVHSGLLAPGQTAQMILYSLGEWPSFTGSTRNGFTTLSYGSYPAMVLMLASQVGTQPILSMLSPGNLLIQNVSGTVGQVWGRDALDSGSWTLLDTISINSSTRPWSDPTTPLPPQRFYRVSVQ